MGKPGKRGYGALASWVADLPSRGRYSFTREEAEAALGLNRKAFNRVARRLASSRKLCRIHGAFYVVVPLEHAAVGVIPADWFIVELMAYLGQPFYVGGLSAAGYHGAAHQRPQWYQVVTNRPVRNIACRGMGIRFFVKREVDCTPVQEVKGVTGYVPVSTPEATAFDLIRYSRRMGGLDHVLTVLQELGEGLDPAKLVRAAEIDGKLAYAQRLGWLIEEAGCQAKARLLARWVADRQPGDVRLEPSLPADQAPRNPRWRLRINTEVEGDLP